MWQVLTEIGVLHGPYASKRVADSWARLLGGFTVPSNKTTEEGAQGAERYGIANMSKLKSIQGGAR